MFMSMRIESHRFILGDCYERLAMILLYCFTNDDNAQSSTSPNENRPTLSHSYDLRARPEIPQVDTQVK